MKNQVSNEVVKSSKELIAEAIAKLSPEDLALIYPPIERANFVVRKSWLGRNQVITFVNNKNQKITYNHDEVLKIMLPKLKCLRCGYEWYPKQPKKPKFCANCNSPYWQTKRWKGVKK